MKNHKVQLTESQLAKIRTAVRKGDSSTAVRLGAGQLSGPHSITIYAPEEKKLAEARKKKKGVELRIPLKDARGGFLQFLPLLLGGLSAAGSVVSGISDAVRASKGKGLRVPGRGLVPPGIPPAAVLRSGRGTRASRTRSVAAARGEGLIGNLLGMIIPGAKALPF